MGSRKGSCKVMMLEVSLDKTTGESFVKQTLEVLGYARVVREVKWYKNRMTKSLENRILITFSSDEVAKKAIMELNGMLLPNSTPATTFNMIMYPSRSEEDKLLLAVKSSHGLILTGYDENVNKEMLSNVVSRYYASLEYIKVVDTVGNCGPKTFLWFTDVRDRDLAVKQLPGLKMKFGNFSQLHALALPFGETGLSEDSESYGHDVAPMQCESNWAPLELPIEKTTDEITATSQPVFSFSDRMQGLNSFAPSFVPTQNLTATYIHEANPMASSSISPISRETCDRGMWSWITKLPTGSREDVDQDQSDGNEKLVMTGRGKGRGWRI